MRPFATVGRCLAALLALAPAAHAQQDGLLLETFGDSEAAVANASLWTDAFHTVGDAVAGLEQAAGLPADEQTIALESYDTEPLPAGPERVRRGLARVAQSGRAGAARLPDLVVLTGWMAPADRREWLTARLEAEVGPLRSALDEAADLATEALVCTGAARAGDARAGATTCGEPVDPSAWLRLRDEIRASSTAVERLLVGTEGRDE